MRLIVTRPDPDCARTATALEALGHTAILSPALDIVLDPAAPLPDGPFQALLVTSSNAVRALAAHPAAKPLHLLPLLAVGDRSALEARRAGFLAASSAGGAVADLLAMVTSQLQPARGPLLYLAGDIRAGDIAGELGDAGFRIETAVLYRSVPRPRMSLPASVALVTGTADGILLYSRASAAAFADAVRAASLAPLPAAVAAFCLSSACSEPLRDAMAGPILVADTPDQLSLFAAIERYGSEAGR